MKTRIEDSVTFSVRVPASFHKELIEAARNQSRSMNAQMYHWAKLGKIYQAQHEPTEVVMADLPKTPEDDFEE